MSRIASPNDHKALANAAAAEYDEKYANHQIVNPVEERLIEKLVVGIPSLKATCVDFGSGTGRLTHVLARIATKVVGYEFSENMLQIATRKKDESSFTNICYQQMDVNQDYRKITYPVSFVCGGYGFGSFVENMREFLRHFEALMVPGGIMYFSLYHDANEAGKNQVSQFGSELGADDTLVVKLGNNQSFRIHAAQYTCKSLLNIAKESLSPSSAVGVITYLTLLPYFGINVNRLSLSQRTEANKYMILLVRKKLPFYNAKLLPSDLNLLAYQLLVYSCCRLYGDTRRAGQKNPIAHSDNLYRLFRAILTGKKPTTSEAATAGLTKFLS